VNKLREDFRVAILGAAAGLFSISVSLLIARVDAYYTYMSWLERTHYQESYYGPVENLWWIPIAIWHLILSITASLVAHRHLATRLRSPFLLWQVIGTASLLGWGLTVLLIVGMECLMSGSMYAPRHALTSGEIADIAKYVSAGFACNVLYASVMKASSRQYTGQFDELACDFSSVDHLLSES
jgi:hypothetical protein